jgi:hypothetical protein
MKRSIALFGVLAITALTFCGCATSHRSATAWEYKVVSASYDAGLEQAINKAAQDGWVFVSASGRGESSASFAVLKKPKGSQ